MSTVKQVLESKSSEIWSVTPETRVYEALQMMADKDIGGLLVIKEGKLVGIFSERDYARKVILEGKSSKDIPVSEIMTQTVLYVIPETTIEECMVLMTAKHVRHLPILENDQLIGILTIGDVVKKIISQQQFTIHQLEKYITGGYVS
ncbi:MAG: CBS domain-containing protein [Gemmatimonadota bacterium]|nr:MAG: CBS domain-containing protein [Gemmatimonadota bacterium]